MHRIFIEVQNAILLRAIELEKQRLEYRETLKENIRHQWAIETETARWKTRLAETKNMAFKPEDNQGLGASDLAKGFATQASAQFGCTGSRDPVSTLIQRRAEGLEKESEMYYWLLKAIRANPLTPEVEAELFNLLTRGYTNRY